jgi:HEAT repeat protein
MFYTKVNEKDLQAVARHLKDPELPHRTHAAKALGTIGSPAKSRVPDLIAALKDKEPLVRATAIWALGKMGDAAKEAVSALTESLNDKDAIVQETAISVLKGMGPLARPAVPTLQALLNREDLGREDKQYIESAIKSIIEVKNMPPKPKK